MTGGLWSRLDDLDHRLYRAERLLVAGVLMLMGVVVFLDVLHRVASREGSWVGHPATVGLVGGLLWILVLRSRGSTRALVGGLGGGVLLVAARWTLLQVFPNGLVWSQTLALALTLWLGFVGASLAAHDRRHLALDIGSKLWPAAWAPRAAALGHVLTAAFSLGLCWLAWRSVAQHHTAWAESEGAVGTLTGLPIPKFVAFASIPYGGLVLAWRFGLDAARLWTGRIALEEDDALASLGIQAPDAGSEGGVS